MTSFPLSFQLSGHLVDNPRSSRVDITLINSSGRMTVSAVQSNTADIHLFEVANSLDLGYLTTLNSPEDVRDLLRLAISLSSKSIIFSKNLLVPLPYDLSSVSPQDNSLFTETFHVGPMTRLLELDENQVFSITAELLMFKFSQPYGRSVEDHNLYEAIQAYLDAADSLAVFTRRRHLWRVLEKSINSQKEFISEKLDKEISSLTGLSEADCKAFRLFENRTKHVATQLKNVHDYMDFLDEEATLTGSLKQVADQVLITKLEQRRKAKETQPPLNLHAV